MLDAAAPRPTDLALRLPGDAYYHLIRTLRLTLPPPPSDSPEDLVRRDHAAIARIAALAPANAAEADVAAQFVAASEQWKECLRLAQQPEVTPEWAHKCRAQANSMMRQANAALRLLLRMQDARRKLETDNTACDRAAWTEHCALGLMADALPSGANPPPQAPAATALSRAGAGRGGGEGADLPATASVATSLSRAAGEGRGEGPDMPAAASDYDLPLPRRGRGPG